MSYTMCLRIMIVAYLFLFKCEGIELNCTQHVFAILGETNNTIMCLLCDHLAALLNSVEIQNHPQMCILRQ
jgi:hypothetical protein